MKYLVVICLFALAGCGQHQDAPAEPEVAATSQVDGQVFVLNKDGVSVPLGMVRVYALEKRAFTSALIDALQPLQPTILSHEQMIGVAMEDSLKAEEQFVGDSKMKGNRILLDSMKLDEKLMADAKGELQETSDSVFDGIRTKNVGHTLTDADGEFHLRARADHQEYLIFARVKRKIYGKDESFVWVVRDWDEATPLLLTPENAYQLSASSLKEEKQQMELLNKLRNISKRD